MKSNKPSFVYLIEYISQKHNFLALYLNRQPLACSDDYSDELAAFEQLNYLAQDISQKLNVSCLVYSVYSADLRLRGEKGKQFADQFTPRNVDKKTLYELVVEGDFQGQLLQPIIIHYVEYFSKLKRIGNPKTPYAATYINNEVVDSTYCYDVYDLDTGAAIIAHESVKEFAESLAIGGGYPLRVSRFDSQDIYERLRRFSEFPVDFVDSFGENCLDDQLLAVAKDIGFFPDKQIIHAQNADTEIQEKETLSNARLETLLSRSPDTVQWVLWSYSDIRRALREHGYKDSASNVEAISSGIHRFGSRNGIQSVVLSDTINRNRKYLIK